MNIINKARRAIFPVIIIVPILMVIAVMAFSNLYINIALESQLSDLNTLSNPGKLASHISQKKYEEINRLISSNPDQLVDQSFLEQLNAKYQKAFSFIIVKNRDQLIFQGRKLDYNIEDVLPSWGAMTNGLEGAYIKDDSMEYLIKQRDFLTTDETPVSLFIFTQMDGIIPSLGELSLLFTLAIIGILLLSSTLISVFMYQKFIKPIRLLKDGTDRIKEGDLESDVEITSDDELGELCASFNDMRVKLKESIDRRLKYETETNELISNISHDLKTPITAIKGYVEGIMDGVADTPEKMDRYIKTIYNKATDMDALINQLSEYSRIDSNVYPYNFAKVAIDIFFADCIEEIKTDLEDKGIDLTFFNYCSEGLLVVADVEQVKRVINNIVTNAAKYIDKEKGHVIIRLKEMDEFIKIEIEDNGKGIAEKDLPFVFNRLYRTDSSRNSSKGGSGLGLAIAKKIIDEHGGKIWATSKEGTGTTFYFTLAKYKEEMPDELYINH